MEFEIIFITEGDDCVPAAEIQFNGQRLCIVRYSPSEKPQIEFVQDLYVGRDTEMIFPLADFEEAVQTALDDLATWRQRLESREPES